MQEIFDNVKKIVVWLWEEHATAVVISAYLAILIGIITFINNQHWLLQIVLCPAFGWFIGRKFRPLFEDPMIDIRHMALYERMYSYRISSYDTIMDRLDDFL